MKKTLIFIFLILLFLLIMYQHELFILTTNIPKLIMWSYRLKDKKDLKKVEN